MSDNDNMVARVAKAIQHIAEQDGGPPYDLLKLQYPRSFTSLHEEAKAAIKAMGEPTEEMIKEAYHGPIVSWKAMIDAALEEK